jgi:hypothetical protein
MLQHAICRALMQPLAYVKHTFDCKAALLSIEKANSATTAALTQGHHAKACIQNFTISHGLTC